MAAIMAEVVTVTCGTRGEHDPDRVAVRHGHDTDASGAPGQIGYKPHYPNTTQR
jgi:hypothetical protein